MQVVKPNCRGLCNSEISAADLCEVAGFSISRTREQEFCLLNTRNVPTGAAVLCSLQSVLNHCSAVRILLKVLSRHLLRGSFLGLFRVPQTARALGPRYGLTTRRDDWVSKHEDVAVTESVTALTVAFEARRYPENMSTLAVNVLTVNCPLPF